MVLSPYHSDHPVHSREGSVAWFAMPRLHYASENPNRKPRAANPAAIVWSRAHSWCGETPQRRRAFEAFNLDHNGTLLREEVVPALRNPGVSREVAERAPPCLRRIDGVKP